jgi:hypothetical protein
MIPKMPLSVRETTRMLTFLVLVFFIAEVRGSGGRSQVSGS